MSETEQQEKECPDSDDCVVCDSCEKCTEHAECTDDCQCESCLENRADIKADHYDD